MADHKHTAKPNIPMYLAAFLFCLTLISIHLSSGLYAKFISTASGSDSARVITFGDITLTETGDFYENNKLMIIPGVDLTKKAVVDFDGSEAATYVFIEVTPSACQVSESGKDFSLMLNGKAAMQWTIAEPWNYLKADNGSYIYYCVVAPNTPLTDVDIFAGEGKIAVSEWITKGEIASLTGTTIQLRATAVQLTGFDSPEAAWSSVSAKEG